jgi:hypothetical protein
MKAFIQFTKTTDINKTTHVLVTLERKQRKPIIALCPLEETIIEEKIKKYLLF